MKNVFWRWMGLGLSVTALTSIVIMNAQLSAQAEMPDNSSNVEASSQLADEIAEYSRSSTPTSADAFLNAPQQIAIAPAPDTQVTAEKRLPSTLVASVPTDVNNSAANVAPHPGTTETSARSLSAIAPTVPPSDRTVAQNNDSEVAQLPVDPGRATRGGSSYIGIGGNIGLSGDTALGDGNFTIISKIGLTRNIAVRPSVVLGNDATFLIPLTYDFSIRQAEALEEVLPLAPYVGAGVSIATGDNDNIGLLLTGGIDVPLNSQFTANAAVNVGIADETDVGLAIGVGYNFSGLGL
ncbi:hypothetical protein [Aliterella atlantica]|uniref:Outer membrane protein beta-barrel domain-containing protein n=1 Tax=Aliterella atlantica CENA595 TaxID=1618023 RepID=A0A0D8ZUF9_9CYAN|nr:hypothetical protein [Aliterella atlantica]KJH70876.1 hypothetical protein UH38_15930 [Aliterella atlantica CENA595]